MTKLEMTKQALIANLNAELQSVANECEYIVSVKGSIHEVCGEMRNYYRDLKVYSDMVSENLDTVKAWSIDDFRYYLHNDSNVQAWLGWIN